MRGKPNFKRWMARMKRRYNKWKEKRDRAGIELLPGTVSRTETVVDIDDGNDDDFSDWSDDENVVYEDATPYDGPDDDDDDPEDDDDDDPPGGGGWDPWDDNWPDEGDPDEPDEDGDNSENMADERIAMERCVKAIAIYAAGTLLADQLPFSPSFPKMDCFIRAWNHIEKIKEKEDEIIDGGDDDDDDGGDNDVDEDAGEDIDDAFDPLANADGSSRKRTLSDGEEEAKVGSKRHRFGGGHHYPASRYNTDQEFLFFQ